jgi:hypothetical protein
LEVDRPVIDDAIGVDRDPVTRQEDEQPSEDDEHRNDAKHHDGNA